MLSKWLLHPLTCDLDINDPRTTELHWQIIQQKLVLRRIYQEWYLLIAAHLPPGSQPVIELGSGGGFLRGYIPGLFTSDIFFYSLPSVVLDG